jgi:penicillin amidase
MGRPKGYLVYFLSVCILILSSFNNDSGAKRQFLNYHGEKVIKGLVSEVTVYRDEKGMPHIYAENEHDLYFATGYIAAQDRLWQMDLIRRSETGRLSEIFGKNFIETDKFFRCLNFSGTSKKILDGSDPAILDCLEAYTNGVNRFIEECGKVLPPEFRILNYRPDPWTTIDIVNLIGMIGWNLVKQNLEIELFNMKLLNKVGWQKAFSLIPDSSRFENIIFPDYIPDKNTINEIESCVVALSGNGVLDLNTPLASNNWAIAGSKSNSGKPVLSNDMHLTLNSPGIWMQVHQVVPGKLNVTGVLLPGEPFIIAGHNDKIAWGMTNMVVDAIDLYLEKVNPDDQDQYLFNGEWHNMSVREEKILVKKGDAEIIKIRSTHRGPVISGYRDTGGKPVSMAWSGLDISDEVRAAYLLNKASDWTQFREAISKFRTISQNFAYADIGGNIGLSAGGGIPVRKYNGDFIRNGETDEFDWKGYVSFDQLPFIFNPSSGYVASANNRTVGRNYPYYISSCFGTPYRFNRIRQMIEGKKSFGIDDHKEIINDKHSDCVARLVPCLLRLDDGKYQFTDMEKKILSEMKKWDFEMGPDIICPTVFEYFRLALLKNLLADELGEIYDDLYPGLSDNYLYYLAGNDTNEWVDNINTPEKESFDDIAFLSFRNCLKDLTKDLGKNPDRWKWGRLHTLRLEHPLGTIKLLNMFFGFNSPTYPIGGSDHTINMFCSAGHGFRVSMGPSVKHIFNTSDWDESLAVIPTGASGIPGSEFYLSQTGTFVSGGFYKDHFSEEAVLNSSKYKLVLMPFK